MTVIEFDMTDRWDSRIRDESVFRSTNRHSVVFAQARTVLEVAHPREVNREAADRVRETNANRNHEQTQETSFSQGDPESDYGNDRHWESDPPSSDPETGTGGNKGPYDMGGGMWAI